MSGATSSYFFHNLSIYVLVCLYGGVGVTWATLLVIPGFALFFLNLLWITMLLATVCARYRDIQQSGRHLLQITLFLDSNFLVAEPVDRDHGDPGEIKSRCTI